MLRGTMTLWRHLKGRYTPPVLTVSPATLWPPNGEQVPVTVSEVIMDEPMEA